MTNLINAETGETILSELELARSFWQRFVGLMFRKSLPVGCGIWIVPCKSIHTMWMRMSIDVHFIDGNNSVIGVRKNVRPWRVVLAPANTTSVLEIQSSTIEIPVNTRVETV